MGALKTALAVSVVLAARSLAQTPSPADPPATHSASFDVADVHLSPHSLRPFMDGGNLNGDRYVIHQATLADLIATAYNLDSTHVQGGPSWLDWDRFEVVAKAPPSTSKADLRLMLQALLKESFNLVTHEGSMPMPAFVM